MKDSGWKEMKDVAASNKVTYNAYLKRRWAGYSPEEAASSKEDMKLLVNKGKLEQDETSEKAMSRQEVLQKIDTVLREKCDPCQTRISMNQRNGSNTSRLEKICINECPVGKQIQALSEYLTVGPRKPVPAVWNR